MNALQALESLRDHVRSRHLSLATERTYALWLRRYMAFLSTRRDLATGTAGEKISAFLNALARNRSSISAHNQALCALVFFYERCLNERPELPDGLHLKRNDHHRLAPTQMDVRRLLCAIGNTPAQPVKLIVSLLYGCGLRLSEVLQLRIKDVDLERGQIVVRNPKNRRDRVVGVPRSLVDGLSSQIRRVRGTWETDHWNGVPVTMPSGPRYAAFHVSGSWPWFWIFPGAKPTRDPRSGRTVRWHCHPAIIRRAMDRVSADHQFATPLTPHHLRHAYATHALDRGANVRALQLAMGHKSLETTQRYLRSDALSVQSPLDALIPR